MTIIHAAYRFTPQRDAVSWFIESRGIDPMVTFRSGNRAPLSECGRLAHTLVTLHAEVERVIPAAAAVIGFYWDDVSGVEAAIHFSPGLLACMGCDAPPAETSLAVGDTWMRVEFIATEAA